MLYCLANNDRQDSMCVSITNNTILSLNVFLLRLVEGTDTESVAAESLLFLELRRALKTMLSSKCFCFYFVKLYVSPTAWNYVFCFVVWV